MAGGRIHHYIRRGSTMKKYIIIIVCSIVLSILVTIILKSIGILNSPVYTGGIVGGIIGGLSVIYLNKNT